MDTPLKLAEAPAIIYNKPDCGTCMEELSPDVDGWMCQICGTCWDFEAGDDTPGYLYEAWSGEKLEGPRLLKFEAFTLACLIRSER